MKKNATPTVQCFDFEQAKAEFLKQVKANPCPGQRNHEEQNAAGRTHIQSWEVPSTQAIIHAVKVLGTMGRGKRKLILIDGYHRLAHWFGLNECPFDKLVIVIHPIEANSPDELTERLDALARTIDSKSAVKANKDRWCAAVRDAGFEDAKSQAYKLGFRANSYFKRVLKSPADSMLKLTARAKEDLPVHVRMDRLFAVSETQMSRSDATEFFHAGVQTAMFAGFRMLPEEKHEAAATQLELMLVKLGQPSTSAIYRMTKLTPEVEAIFNRLSDLATQKEKTALRAIGNREDYYNAVIEELKPLVEAFCASLAQVGKKRSRKAA